MFVPLQVSVQVNCPVLSAATSEQHTLPGGQSSGPSHAILTVLQALPSAMQLNCPNLPQHSTPWLRLQGVEPQRTTPTSDPPLPPVFVPPLPPVFVPPVPPVLVPPLPPEAPPPPLPAAPLSLPALPANPPASVAPAVPPVALLPPPAGEPALPPVDVSGRASAPPSKDDLRPPSPPEHAAKADAISIAETVVAMIRIHHPGSQRFMRPRTSLGSAVSVSKTPGSVHAEGFVQPVTTTPSGPGRTPDDQAWQPICCAFAETSETLLSIGRSSLVPLHERHIGTIQ